MNKCVLLIAVLFPIKIFSQAINITGNWKMNIGDSLSWANVSYDDHEWKSVEKIGPFERKDFPEFQNFGWIRKSIVIPSASKDAADKCGYIYISLGKVYDADQVYFNGKLIGETGRMPPKGNVVERGARIYKVSSKYIDWDKENLLAVRIFSNFHNGGVQGDVCDIIIPSETIFQQASATVSAYPLPKEQIAYVALIKAALTDKDEAEKSGGMSLKIKLPKDASIFFNEKYLGTTNLAGDQMLFVPLSFISWNNSDRLLVYVDSSDALQQVLYANPTLTATHGDPFQFMQVTNLKVIKGRFDGKSPVTVSVKVLNHTNSDFDGKLTITLTTDINNSLHSSTRAFHLSKLRDTAIDFTLETGFSGIYQVNYVLQNQNGQQLTGILAKGATP